VPFGLLNGWLAWRYLPRAETSPRRFDRLSALLNAAMFGLFFVGADGIARGGGDWPSALALGLAVAAGVALVRRNLGVPAPLVPIDLLRNPVSALSVVASVCAFVAFIVAFVALPFHFQGALGLDQVQTGLLMTPWPVALGLAAPLAGYLSDKIPAGSLGAFGMVLLAVGLALLARLPVGAAPVDIAWRMALCGFGFGMFQSPNNRTMLAAAPRSRSGAAGGMLATARLLGMTLGATLTALVFHFAPGRAETVGLTLASGFAVAAGAASLMRLSRRASPA
jgi:DHA2 family multidrug resistance protein-like MFS transporter